METTKRENQVPMLWYWSVPENGMDIEDCEMIAKENLVNCQINRYRDCISHLFKNEQIKAKKAYVVSGKIRHMPF